ncbi:MAG: hypothetical protein EXS39_05300 [Opitutaceae bacterium]|nr:hypothetical protein [Opitutaceae bacterium]
MAYFRQYPWFSTALLLLGLVLVVEIGGIYERRHTLRRAELELERKRRELKKLADMRPAPTLDNAAAIEVDVMRMERALAATETEFAGRRPAAGQLQEVVSGSRKLGQVEC